MFNSYPRPRIVLFLIAGLMGYCLFSETAIGDKPKSTDGTRQNENDSENAIRNATNVICGPKCIDFLLKFYEVDRLPGLVELTRELQGDELFQGASLQSLSDYLNKNHVHTAFVGLSSSARLNWNYPVIVHLNSSNSGELGHFVVWLPSSAPNQVEFWDGDKGVVAMTPSKWLRIRSGSMLLTSPTKITDISEAAIFASLESDTTYTRMLALIVFLIGLFICVTVYFPKGFLSFGKSEPETNSSDSRT